LAIPGCFSTAILLASVPLLSSGIAEPTLFVSGVTGSTGSGRKPVEGTHHPTRHSDLYSYGALGHRHTPEITALAEGRLGRRG
jgi:N-acetyl-gamma-glutamyl-phosphate reductase